MLSQLSYTPESVLEHSDRWFVRQEQPEAPAGAGGGNALACRGLAWVVQFASQMLAFRIPPEQPIDAMAATTESKTRTGRSRRGSDGQTKAGGAAAAGGKKEVNVFHQRLASLTYHQACQMIGASGEAIDGARRMRIGNRFTEIDLDRGVYLGGDLLRIRMADCDAKHAGEDERPEASVDAGSGPTIVTMTLQSRRAKQITINCDRCDGLCHHMGAALDYLLDAKSILGLAAPPDASVPLENLTDKELQSRAIAERQKRADEEPMTVRSMDPNTPWTDYVVTSQNSGQTYRVSIRSLEDQDRANSGYCSCPDFRTNRLGSCKHTLHVAAKVRKRFTNEVLNQPYQRPDVSLRVHHGLWEDDGDFGLRFCLPTKPNAIASELVGHWVDRSAKDAGEVFNAIGALENAGVDFRIYPDAEDYLQRQEVLRRLGQTCDQIRRDPAAHPLRTELLDATLLPYQIDGIAFAASAGRAILADDMGLGKTIQGIGVAELLAREADLSRVLVVCPASLKSQWRSEVQRFSGRSVQLILGTAEERQQQYRSDKFFTVCNYEQVLRDMAAVEAVPWDLIILDEGQRIKNWESQTSNKIRMLQSRFRLVLSGTPLENNLGELFTVARFVDEQRLGPAYQFFQKHRVLDDRCKTIGYQRLDELRQTMRPILLRRTRAEVAKQLPERIDEIVRVIPTDEQLEVHAGQMQIVAQITAKKYLTEVDLLRLRRALAMGRMVCDSTYLVDQKLPEYSTKLQRLAELLEGLLADPARKIVIFSEWKRMLDRVESKLDALGATHVRLDGSVNQKKRPAIVEKFQSDPDCRVLLMTNAGATGLNLQSANVVINCDLPWNPAILEQRIARAHRMGQKNPVHVYNMVSVGTIEEQLLDTLAAKQDLADASLNFDSQVGAVAVGSGSDDLKRRLEKLIGPLAPAPVDVSQQRRVESEAAALHQRREKVSEATGQLVTAALGLAGQLMGTGGRPPADPSQVDTLAARLSESMEVDDQGRPQLRITLPDQAALRGLAESLASLLSGAS